MVTRILFDPRRDLTDGTTTSSPVTVTATPTGIRETGQTFILPTSLTFTVNTGADVVQLAPNQASTAWRLTVTQDGSVKQTRVVRVPDQPSVTWQALVDVDPNSLGETTGHARQWDATFDQLVALIAAIPSTGGGGGSSGFQYTQAVAASTWTITHPLGRRPTVDLYLLDGTQVFSDITATTTQVTATFPSPQTGYAVLT